MGAAACAGKMISGEWSRWVFRVVGGLEWTASSAAELLTIAGLVNVLADVLKDTTQADEPSFSIANRVRANDLTPPTADDIEPLPSSTKHASTRVVHFSIGGIGGIGGGGGDGDGGGGDGGGGGGDGGGRGGEG